MEEKQPDTLTPRQIEEERKRRNDRKHFYEKKRRNEINPKVDTHQTR